MNILVGIVLVPAALLATPRPPAADAHASDAADTMIAVAQWHCENPRDLVADALLGECGQQAQGGSSGQDDKKRPQKWWRGEDTRAEFGITDEQSKNIEAVFQQALPTLKANKNDLDREEKALSALLGAPSSDEATVVKAIERVETARSALSRTFTLMQYRMYRFLSPEQRAKVQSYHEHRAQDSGLSTRR